MAEKYTAWEDCRALGTGTFGVVRAAFRKSDGIEVALKRFKRGGDYSNVGVSYSALREIRVMKEISHPNIVQLFDVFINDGFLTIVLELLSSTDLEGVIRKAREGTIVLKPNDIKSYFYMLLQGLSFLHSNYIIHRDLKPGNIFLTNHGILKIGDFGFARTDITNPLSKLSPNACTQWYRSPELLYGAINYNFKMDIWSCGCIFAELFLLYPIFRGDIDLKEGLNEIDQLSKIFMYLGTPTDVNWPKHNELLRYVEFQITSKAPFLLNTETTCADELACILLDQLLTLNPNDRISSDDALKSDYFNYEFDQMTPPEMLPR